VSRPTTERREMDELERLESAKSVLRDALEFIKDDDNLTAEGRAARDGLLRAIEAIERDLEAFRQEHTLE
jgi:hypothetical protein